MRLILFIHQAADLYGSDKVLLDMAIGIQKYGFIPIVLLPADGPLLSRLQASGIETRILKVAKLSRAVLSIFGLLRLPFEILRSVWQIDRAVAGRKIFAVHSNTLAVLGGAFWAKWRKVPHLWHIHELIQSPWIARAGFPWLVLKMADKVICNSNMTAKWVFEEQPFLKHKTVVVWNGLERSNPPLPPPMLIGDRIVVALVGRINRLKGQSVFVDAATHLWKQGFRHITYLIVGSTPVGQEHYLEQIKRLISQSPASTMIEIKDFTENIWSIWDACDIAVVPSTEPESFGLVAIEAMAAGKPVIAAAHGGLLDIVVDGETGYLIQPGNPTALAEAIAKLVSVPELRIRFGDAGRKRQADRFTLSRQIEETVHCYESMRIAHE